MRAIKTRGEDKAVGPVTVTVVLLRSVGTAHPATTRLSALLEPAGSAVPGSLSQTTGFRAPETALQSSSNVDLSILLRYLLINLVQPKTALLCALVNLQERARAVQAFSDQLVPASDLQPRSPRDLRRVGSIGLRGKG